MVNNKFGIRKAKTSLPPRDLLDVPQRGEVLTVSHPAFGPNTYDNNMAEMAKKYFHSEEHPEVSFRPATTSESISAASYDVAETKRTILDPRRLQLGRIVRTSEGVFTNTEEIDERILRTMLNGVEQVNGIYLINDKIAFVPYNSFTQGVQDSGKFVEGGLARALEHTEGKRAENLGRISSPEFYKKGVNVWGFDEVSEPVLRVVTGDSDRGIYGGRLAVYDVSWYGDYDGYAYGIPTNTQRVLN